MVEIAQGEIWWGELGEPKGSLPGYRRPLVVIQGNSLNRSRLATVVCVAVTGNLEWAAAPGNVLLPSKASHLPKDSVANVSQIFTVDRSVLEERVSKLAPRFVEQILAGVDTVLGR